MASQLIRVVRILLLALAFIPAIWGHPAKVRRATPPSQDPFYTPPSGFASAAPGTILRQRNVVVSFFGLIPEPVEGWQLLFRTTAIDGSAIATVTTIFKPANAATDRFVSFQTAYDSSATICDPSYNYELGSAQVSLISSAESLLLQAYLLSGYIVASTDYEGPDAAFTPGRLEGPGVLDGMRAVKNFGSTLGLTTSNPMIAGVGYSGGGIATSWAAALQPSYAPELNIKGWASGGTPANLTGTLVYIDKTVFSGFSPAAIDGLSKPSAYGAQLNPLINSIATSEGKSKLSYANSNCAAQDITNFAFQSVLSTQFQTLGAGLLTNPTISNVLDQCILGVNSNETPKAPVYLYHASQDEIIPYADAETLDQRWCANGASVQFVTFGNGGHLTTEILGLPGSLLFVHSAFAGTVGSGCSSSSVLDSTLNPLALGASLEPLLTKLINILGALGEGDANLVKDVGIISKIF